MAKLTAAARRALPDSAFAIPSRRAYPVMDAGHRQAALGRVGQFGTPAEKKQVRAAVHRRAPSMGRDRAIKNDHMERSMLHSMGYQKK